MNRRQLSLISFVILFFFIGVYTYAWDVSVRFDAANQGPIRPFTSAGGSIGTTYYEDFGVTDTFGPDDYTNDGRYVNRCSTGCGTNCYWANLCRSSQSATCNAVSCADNPYDSCVCFDTGNCYRNNGWFTLRTNITNDIHKYEILGTAHADCYFSGHGLTQGVSVINPAGNFEITSVDYCSANGDNKGQGSYCTIDMPTGVISWKGGSTCGGCCACEDSGSVYIRMTVESIADTNPPTLNNFNDPGEWTNDCNIQTAWSCTDSNSGMSTTEPYKLYRYNNGLWNDLGWTTNTSHSYMATEFDNIAYGLECKDMEGNVGGPWYTTQYTRCDMTQPTPTISINNNQIVTNITSVNLILGYTDAGSGIFECRYKNESMAWTNWQTCVPNKLWTTTSGDGIKTIYYELKDKVGNVNQTSDTIILDTIPPSLIAQPTSFNIISPQNITFNALCDDLSGSGCNTTHITIPSLSKQCNILGGTGSCDITTEECAYGTHEYTINATDFAKNQNITTGLINIYQEEGCDCVLSQTYCGTSCVEGVCSSSGNEPFVYFNRATTATTVKLSTIETIYVNVKNPTYATKSVSLYLGSFDNIKNWVWFDGHKYDSGRRNISIQLGPKEERTITVKVLGGMPGQYNLAIGSDDNSINKYDEITVNVISDSNTGGIFSSTPGLGIISLFIIMFLGGILR